MWVRDVITRREVSNSLIFTPRKQLRDGKFAGVVPVSVEAAVNAGALTRVLLVMR